MEEDAPRKRRSVKSSYFDTVSHIIQQRVVDGFANVTHWPLHVAGGDDLVSAGGVLVCGQDADLSTRHLLLMDVHRLCEDRTWGAVSMSTTRVSHH